jgi:hypothetical protein
MGPNYVDAAVGDHGILYFAGPDRVVATCGGREVLWTRRLPTTSLDVLRVYPDGTPWIRWQYVWRPLSRRGELGPPTTNAGPCGDLALGMDLCDGPVTGGSRFVASLDAELWSIETTSVSRSALWDARGLLWLDEGAGPGSPHLLRRHGPSGVVFEMPGLWLAPGRFAPLEDGSFFGNVVDSLSSDVGIRDPNTGLVRWQLPVEDPMAGVLTGIRSLPAISPSGVAYFAGGRSVYAYQLDRLPPEEPYCLGAYCGNARMDNAAQRFEN